VLLAVVYGSFVRRSFFRDLDVAVYTGGLAEDPLRLEATLCAELTEALGLPVDARVIDEAPPWFKLKVLEEGVVIYEKKRGARYLMLKEAIGEKQDLTIKLKTVGIRGRRGQSATA